LNKKYVPFGLAAALILFMDQATKVYIDATMPLHDSVSVIPGFFNITHVRNPGAAFGFLAGASPLFRNIFFVSVTVAAILLILHYVRTSQAEEKHLTFSLSLILSGAVGNLIDRVRFGEVIDFLDVYIASHHWPAFNVADSAITVGAVILFIELLRRGKERNIDSKRP
jgi:signal peptidase II